MLVMKAKATALLYPHSCARLPSSLCSELNIIPACSTQTPQSSPPAEASPGTVPFTQPLGSTRGALKAEPHSSSVLPHVTCCSESWCKQHGRHRLLWLIKPGLYRESTRKTGTIKPNYCDFVSNSLICLEPLLQTKIPFIPG